MTTYDRDALLSALMALPFEAYVAFAVGCAARTLGVASADLSLSDRDLVASALRLVCDAWPDYKARAGELGHAALTLESSANPDDDAMASAAYVLRAVLGKSPQDAMWAAERAYNARDSEAQRELVFSVYTPEVEAALLSSPGVQNELGQQQSDIARLQRGTDDGEDTIRHALGAPGA